VQAKYPGVCPACLTGIAVGQDVNKLVGRWVHSGCMPEDPESFQAPENWKWRGQRTMAGGRLLTRSKAVHGRPYRYQ
jgi:hypothetical protein